MADSLFNTVSLLLPLDGPAGGTTFRDYSANHLAVTTVGNTSAKSVGKYNGSAAYFDGTGDRLTCASSALTPIGTGDFTIEFWVLPSAQVQLYPVPIASGSHNTGSWQVQIGSTGVGLKVQLWVDNHSTAAALMTGTTTLSTTGWSHVAVTRIGTSCTIWVNGVSDATATSAVDMRATAEVMVVGGDQAGTATSCFTGYISNLRISKGVARYTATFTPPAGPIRHALDPNVVLRLTGEDLFDYSQIAHVITASGNLAASATQFKYGTKSLAFDGTGDYIDIPSNAAFGFGTGDFTIEAWIRMTSLSRENMFIDMRPNGTNGAYIGGWTITSAGAMAYGVSSSSRITAPDATITINTWYHVAVCRSGTSTKMFVDGTQVGSTWTDTTSYLTTRLSLGRNVFTTTTDFTGYIDDFTITRRAKYTATFTPPSAALPTETTADEYLSSVSLQLQMDGTNASTTFTDSSPTPKTVTAVGNAQISTTQSRFGGSAMYLDGTGDYATVAADASLAMGTGDFTAEAWIYLTALPAECVLFGDILWTAGYQGGWCMAVTSTGILRITYNGTGSTWTNLDSAISLVTANAWHHVATVRQNGVQRIYLNGVQVGSVANTLDYTTGRTFRIGGKMVDGVVRVLMTGYIDDLRITKGVARYV